MASMLFTLNTLAQLKKTPTVIALVFSSFVLLHANVTYAVLPPAYLQIKNWQLCTATQSYGRWQGVCLPTTRPNACSRKSWLALSATMSLPVCHPTLKKTERGDA